jgi:hypothetical protein
MAVNFKILNDIHKGLFLGTASLRQFRDQRLVVSVMTGCRACNLVICS